MVKRYWRKWMPAPALVGKRVYELLASMGGSPEDARLASLWNEWEKALGTDLARAATPLGRHNRVLIIKAQDSIQMQELHFLIEEMLEKVNRFLNCEYFTSIRLTLSESGKICTQENIAPAKKEDILTPPAQLSGKYLGMMDVNSPVCACYKKFVLACS